jgi:hypothetical protein
MIIKFDGYSAIDTDEFAEFCALGLLQDGITVRSEAWTAYAGHFHRWEKASLVAVTESGAYVLTPRGEDLRASLPLLTAAKPETAAKPCSKCHGTGEQPLFVSMETCSRCEGSKVEPARSSGIDFNTMTPYTLQVVGARDTQPHIGYSALTDGTVSYFQDWYRTQRIRLLENVQENPWVLIDSEETARSFVGERVEVCAEGIKDRITVHPLHGKICEVTSVNRCYVVFSDTHLHWAERKNVSLRVVDGDTQ